MNTKPAQAKVKRIMNATHWLNDALIMLDTTPLQPAWVYTAGNYTGRAMIALLGRPQPGPFMYRRRPQ